MHEFEKRGFRALLDQVPVQLDGIGRLVLLLVQVLGNRHHSLDRSYIIRILLKNKGIGVGGEAAVPHLEQGRGDSVQAGRGTTIVF